MPKRAQSFQPEFFFSLANTYFRYFRSSFGLTKPLEKQLSKSEISCTIYKDTVANPTSSKMEGILKIWHRLPLLIAVPTTAGTGSETTLAAVITDADTHHKYAINDFNLIPDYAVLEPSVTYGLPPQLTATTSAAWTFP